MADAPGPHDLLDVGSIRRAHGLRGEVFVQLTSNADGRLVTGAELFTPTGRLVVESSRVASNGRHVVKFAGIDDRTTAERYANVVLRGRPIEDPDALWVHELIGARVVEADGTERGTCVAVVANPAADLIELDTGALVPTTFVVSFADGRIVVDVPEGLFDLVDG